MMCAISQPVFATELVVGDDETYTSIQAAVDAASEGDVVLIKARTDSKGWRENVVINTNNLTIRGDTVAAKANLYDQICPDVILDGCETPSAPTSCDRTIMTINATGISVERLLFRHGEIIFSDTASNVVLKNSCIIGDNSDVINSEGSVPSAITISSNVFQGGDSESIVLNGDNHVIKDNQFFAIDDGIKITGDDAQIVNNRIYQSNDQGIYIIGDNGLIENNIVIGGEEGIEYKGDNPTIKGNFVRGMYDDAIYVNCSNCSGGLISHNRLVGSSEGDSGISIDNANNMMVVSNHVSLISEEGILFDGGNSIISNNTILRSGIESSGVGGLTVRGYGNSTIENNLVKYSTFIGIEQNEGDGNTYNNNIIFGSGNAGVIIYSGSNTVVNGNTIKNGLGEGIANIGGTNTVITNNTVTGNRTDICNNASITTFTGNSNATGGTATNCIVDAEEED
ncbi:MAG: surface layer protein B [Candidatus Magnetoglobus multicellularis str. Araruama]|uniref:Surface layer protein B n=1 Tax=Candidatus Magnetoglobus multicellularis str. Araruama TaxID=890399 RepID=A0A1V1P903_9BACT|nr:MAG: surface layer protein B [Candidatus Magnetoglobus multicellularis str. Araruama]